VKKIFIIDKYPKTVKFLNNSLRALGFATCFAFEKKYIFSLIEEEKPDIILLDFDLKGCTGLDVLKSLKLENNYKEIPVIMLAEVNDRRIISECFREGAVDFIFKPVKILELKSRLNSALVLSFEKYRYKSLLNKIFPTKVSSDLYEDGYHTPNFFPSATVGFTDFSSFTKTVKEWSPSILIERLEQQFVVFDSIMEAYGLETLKTIGDSYMFAGGLPDESKDHAVKCTLAALSILEFVEDCEKAYKRGDIDYFFPIRVGLNTGPVIAGVIGHKKLAYDIWGNTVNLAQRMESQAPIGGVCISAGTYQYISKMFDCSELGLKEIKGEGKQLIYIVKGLLPEFMHLKKKIRTGFSNN